MGIPRDPAARIAGWLLLATAVTTVVAVVGRVSARADLATLAESLAAIAAHRTSYAIGGAARLVSGVTLLAGSWFLLHTWIMRKGLGSRPVPALLAISRLTTAVSGASAVALAIAAPADAVASVSGGLAAAEGVRWNSGKVGFSLAGLALIAAAHRQWLVGGFLRVRSLRCRRSSASACSSSGSTPRSWRTGPPVPLSYCSSPPSA